MWATTQRLVRIRVLTHTRLARSNLKRHHSATPPPNFRALCCKPATGPTQRRLTSPNFRAPGCSPPSLFKLHAEASVNKGSISNRRHHIPLHWRGHARPQPSCGLLAAVEHGRPSLPSSGGHPLTFRESARINASAATVLDARNMRASPLCSPVRSWGVPPIRHRRLARYGSPLY
uniref:Uncharacterized protein n=1 Tax=Arundo donax TaxID=35708 RepID=A0A0A9ESP1_ARUDO